MFESFHFEGFDPSHELQLFAKRSLWQLDAEAPSDSSSDAVICKTSSGYEGRLNIVSSTGAFRARVTGSTPEKVINYLCDKVRTQLYSWRKRRFDIPMPHHHPGAQLSTTELGRVLAKC